MWRTAILVIIFGCAIEALILYLAASPFGFTLH